MKERNSSPFPSFDSIKWTDNVSPVDPATEAAVLSTWQDVQLVADLDRRKRQRISQTQLALYIAMGLSLNKVINLTRQPSAQILGMWNALTFARITRHDLRNLGQTVSAEQLPAAVSALLQAKGATRRKAGAA
jgi:hypothetical protein